MEISAKCFDWDSVGLDFGQWDDEKLWALEVPVTQMNIEELFWHFGVPFLHIHIFPMAEIAPCPAIARNCLQSTHSTASLILLTAEAIME